MRAGKHRAQKRPTRSRPTVDIKRAVWLLESARATRRVPRGVRTQLIDLLTKTDAKDIKWKPLGVGGTAGYTQGKWMAEFPGGVKAIYKTECANCNFDGTATDTYKEIAASKFDLLMKTNIVPLTLPFVRDDTHGCFKSLSKRPRAAATGVPWSRASASTTSITCS